VGATPIEYIDLPVDVNGTHKPTLNLAYPNLSVDEISFADQSKPSIGEPHISRIAQNGGRAER
jgi:hypothetical protein